LRRACSVAVLLLVAAACNSTNHLAEERTALAEKRVSETKRGGVGPESTSGPRSRVAAAPGAPTVEGEKPADVGDAEPGATRMGKGVDGSSIRIGIELTRGAEDVFASFGTTTEQGDTRSASTAVIDYINAKGGVAGRKLVGVFHETDTNAGSAASQATATCARFTQDDEVFAVLSGHILLVGQHLADCLAKAKTPLVSALYYPWDNELFTKWHGYLYEPSYVSSSKWGVWIDQLVANKFFGSSARIGVVRYDGPLYQRIMDRAIKPALKRHSLSVAAEWAPTEADSVASVGATGAGTSNGILRFRQAGITHVLFVAAQGSIEFFWMPQADSQNYRPRYGLNSFEKPDFLQNNVPKSQLRNAMGIGWQPMVDVADAQDPGGRSGGRTCDAAFKAAGLTFPDRNSRRFAMQYCDGLLFLKAALDRAATDLTPEGMRAAVDALGDSYDSPLAFGTRFGEGRSDGAELVRTLVFSDGCSCFTYAGPAKPIG
jgi:hypothetical protein